MITYKYGPTIDIGIEYQDVANREEVDDCDNIDKGDNIDRSDNIDTR
jgi:hypothetical protein